MAIRRPAHIQSSRPPSFMDPYRPGVPRMWYGGETPSNSPFYRQEGVSLDDLRKKDSISLEDLEATNDALAGKKPPVYAPIIDRQPYRPADPKDRIQKAAERPPAKLAAQATQSRYVTRNSSREAIRELQRSLAALGFNPGPIDGALGRQTKEAVEAFQKANDLPADGVVGPDTLGALNSDAAEGASRLPRPRPELQAVRPAPLPSALPAARLAPISLSAAPVGYGTPTASVEASGELPEFRAPLSLSAVPVGAEMGVHANATANRPIPTQEFDPLSGNSGRGKYTQVDPAKVNGIGEQYRPETPRSTFTLDQLFNTIDRYTGEPKVGTYKPGTRVEEKARQVEAGRETSRGKALGALPSAGALPSREVMGREGSTSSTYEPAKLSQDPRLNLQSKDDQITPIHSFGRTPEEKARTIASRLMGDFGLTSEQAAGVVGNLAVESQGKGGWFTALQEIKPVGGGKGGLGWAQWTNSGGGTRRTDFIEHSKLLGLDPQSDEANYRFLSFELRTNEKKALETLKTAQTAEEAAQVFQEAFERPGIPHSDRRVEAAKQIYDDISNQLAAEDIGISSDPRLDSAALALAERSLTALPETQFADARLADQPQFVGPSSALPEQFGEIFGPARISPLQQPLTMNAPPAGGVPYTRDPRMPTMAESYRRMEDFRETERAKARTAMPPAATATNPEATGFTGRGTGVSAEAGKPIKMAPARLSFQAVPNTNTFGTPTPHVVAEGKTPQARINVGPVAARGSTGRGTSAEASASRAVRQSSFPGKEADDKSQQSVTVGRGASARASPNDSARAEARPFALPAARLTGEATGGVSRGASASDVAGRMRQTNFPGKDDLPAAQQRMTEPTWPSQKEAQSLTAPTMGGIAPKSVSTMAAPDSRSVTTQSFRPPADNIDFTRREGRRDVTRSVFPNGLQRIDPTLPDLQSTWNAPALTPAPAPQPRSPAPTPAPTKSLMTGMEGQTGKEKDDVISLPRAKVASLPVPPGSTPSFPSAVRPAPTVTARPRVTTPARPPASAPPATTQKPAAKVAATPPSEEGWGSTFKRWGGKAVDATEQAITSLYLGSGPIKQAEILTALQGGTFWENFAKVNTSPTGIAQASFARRDKNAYPSARMAESRSGASRPSAASGVSRQGVNNSYTQSSYQAAITPGSGSYNRGTALTDRTSNA